MQPILGNSLIAHLSSALVSCKHKMPTVFWHDNFIPTPCVGNESPLVWETNNAVCTTCVGDMFCAQLFGTQGSPSLTVTVGEVVDSLRRHPGDAVIHR